MKLCIKKAKELCYNNNVQCTHSGITCTGILNSLSKLQYMTSCLYQFMNKIWCFCLRDFYRVPKCDVIENEICEIMGFVKTFWKNNIQDAYSPKISSLGQIVSEILTQLCSDDSIQILVNLTWFLILWTKPNLEGFVWKRHSITGHNFTNFIFMTSSLRYSIVRKS